MARDLTSDDPLKQQKARALRIDHQYFTKPHPWRTWMKRLSLFLPLVCVAAVALFGLRSTGNASLYMPGPISTKHASFGHRCGECHEGDSTHWGEVLDRKCARCHDGPLHNPRQVYHTNFSVYMIDGQQQQIGSATCASCHTEHQGNLRLADISDRHCTQCHGDIKVSAGSPSVDAQIRSFTDGHSDWDSLRTPDPSQLNFNHATHMKPSVKTAAGTALNCTSCHAADQAGRYMQPINYEMHCQACHPISIPPVANIGTVPLPHDKPAIVSSLVKTAFSDYLFTNGGKVPPRLSPNPEFVPPKPGRKPKPGIPEFLEQPDTRAPQKWLDENITSTLQPLFFPESKQLNSSCVYCHISAGKEAGTELPRIIDPRLPTIWLTRGRFNHQSHRVLGCVECHAQALTSSKTEDVLLPNIQSCQKCHSQVGGARSGCSECHTYHDKQHPNMSGNLMIEELLSGKRPFTPPPAAPTNNATATPEAPPELAPAAPKTEGEKKE